MRLTPGYALIKILLFVQIQWAYQHLYPDLLRAEGTRAPCKVPNQPLKPF